MSTDSEEMFELAPVSLWLEDYSALHALFTRWRALGVTDLRQCLRDDVTRVAECTRQLRVLQVNRKTLELFEATDLAHLVAHLDHVFRDAMLEPHIDELVALWNGEKRFSSQTVNYSLSGKRLDILLNGTVLPGHEATWDRVLISIENITNRIAVETRLMQAERYANGLFQDSPVSLWVEDFSTIKRLLDEVRSRGIEDFRVFTQVHPEFVTRCMQEIRVIDVNQRTLDMFNAPDKQTLLNNLDKVFRARDRMTTSEVRGKAIDASFADIWTDKWAGKVKNKSKGGSGVAGVAGAPKAGGAAASKKPTTSLFA